ncbi:MAG TPA: serine/threonine-protein kinase, partial [Thermoanaerobaculia bacterium]|nr:serine/threonine-protein kinase [Thermoanaerobaculia bacterium]
MPEKGLSGSRLTKLGRYEVLSELGKGAMGVVYLAKDPVIGRLVAIKTIRTASLGDDDSELREFKERFVREAQTAGILNHPNIVTIHDIGEDADTRTSFIAMEYIEGKNLKSMLSEKTKLTYDQIAGTIAQVGEALDYAHRKGIIHRDVKPANIIITTDRKVKITDFGIAKIASSNLTSTGQFLGTPNYMSPEQVSGAPVDGRSDIFSLGVVLYELLTNRKPFLGDSLTAISYKIVHEDFTPPAELLAEVPSDFNAIVARAMAKDPWNRYQRGKDFALALHQLRAHLEEQNALQELGSMVSAAENMPTLRLENLAHFLPGTEPEATLVPPPSDDSDVGPTAMLDVGVEPVAVAAQREAAAAARWSTAEVTRAIVLPTELLKPPDEPAPESSAESTNPTAKALAEAAAGSAALPETPREYLPALPPPLPPPPPARRQPHPQGPRTGQSPAALRASQAIEKAREWSQLLKLEVNRRWFYAAAGGWFVLVLLICGLIFIRSRVAARPTVVDDATLAHDTEKRKQALDEGKKLFNAGRYEESLALFRQVLARSPNNLRARQYAQMSENALQGRVEEARKSSEADRLIEAGRTAFGEGKFAEARERAEEALAEDGGKIEAQRLKEDASAKLAELEAAAAAETRKKKAREAQAKKSALASEPATVRRPASAQSSPGAPASAATATLNLTFDSPISEGTVMVAVNDQIRLKLPFSFKRKVSIFKTVKETGTVTGTMAVDPGSVGI